MQRPTRRDLERIIGDMFRELGQSPITDTRAAGIKLARKIAERIVSGGIPPYDGARVIWRTIYYRLHRPDELVPFVGLASEWEDHPDLRGEYGKDIVEAAKTFLNAEWKN